MNQAFSKIWIVIVLVTLLIGGIFAWQYFGIQEKETANWQVYRDKELGFEVKYPEIWPAPKTYDYLPGIVEFVSADYQEQEMGKVMVRAEITAGTKIDIGIGKIPENITWREWVTLGRGAIGDTISSEFTIFAGKEVYRQIMEGSKVEGITGINYIRMTFPDQDQQREIIFTLYTSIKDLKKNEKVFNQMIPTFQFIEPEKVKISGTEIIESIATKTILAIKNKDMEKLSGFIHPDKGVRFSPYTYVRLERDLVFSVNQILNFFNDQKTYTWGVYDGSGLPIELTKKEYFEKFIYDKDFAKSLTK